MRPTATIGRDDINNRIGPGTSTATISALEISENPLSPPLYNHASFVWAFVAMNTNPTNAATPTAANILAARPRNCLLTGTTKANSAPINISAARVCVP